MDRKITRLICFAIYVLSLAGCNSEKSGPWNVGTSTWGGIGYSYPVEIVATPIPVQEMYPYLNNDSSQNSGKGNETNGYPLTFIIPTPAYDKVVFTGQMLTPGIGGAPFIGDIYLGYLISANQSDFPPLIKFSENVNPKAVVNSKGYFYFSEIEPGEYALVIYSLGGTYIVPDENGETMFIKGEAGQLVDVGIISVP